MICEKGMDNGCQDDKKMLASISLAISSCPQAFFFGSLERILSTSGIETSGKKKGLEKSGGIISLISQLTGTSDVPLNKRFSASSENNRKLGLNGQQASTFELGSYF